MSLARTALRLAAIEALNADPVIAALCEGRVYDSRMEDFDRKEPVPIIIVTTDDDQGEGVSGNGDAPFLRTVEINLEIAVRVVSRDDATNTVTIGSLATDRELEATLDLIEERAVEALTVGEGPAAALVRKVTRTVPRLKSTRFVTDEVGEKLAIRLVTLTANLKGEDRHAADIPTGPFARLPDPLRTVCQAMPADSSALATCQMIHDALPPLEVELYTGADLTLRPDPSQPRPQPGEGEQHAPLVQLQAIRP